MFVNYNDIANFIEPSLEISWVQSELSRIENIFKKNGIVFGQTIQTVKQSKRWFQGIFEFTPFHSIISVKLSNEEGEKTLSDKDYTLENGIYINVTNSDVLAYKRLTLLNGLNVDNEYNFITISATFGYGSCDQSLIYFVADLINRQAIIRQRALTLSEGINSASIGDSSVSFGSTNLTKSNDFLINEYINLNF